MRKKQLMWEVIRVRARGEYLGRVEAPDHEAALKVAVKKLGLNKAEEKRLLVRPA